MASQLFHIFRNNPLGRETFLQSLYFCKVMQASIVIYIPNREKFLMYFENNIVQVDLDKSYITSQKTAKRNVNELVKEIGIKARFIKPKTYTASELPDIQPNFDFMCCPRSISDLSSKIGLGYIGPRVRHIVNSAQFPVLLSSPAFKEWQSIAVFLGGSVNAVNAFNLGLRISRVSGLPVEVFTQIENGTRESYEDVIEKNTLEKEMNRRINKWLIFEKGDFEENLYQVPHNALVILGASGHSVLKTIVFGSKMEKIHSSLPNNLLIVGPNYIERTHQSPNAFPL
jgi:nucleotide-binding universal stress UspA family protein